MNDTQTRYFELIQESWNSDSFVKLSFGNYVGEEPQLKNCYIKRIVLKNEIAFSFTYRYKTKDIVKNFPLIEALQKAKDLLISGFKVSTLFTTESDYIFEELLNKKCRIRKQLPSSTGKVTLTHDRTKNRVIASKNKVYLNALQITDEKGQVYKSAQDKFKQINHFIELLQPLIQEIGTKEILRVMDMGSGKGYLTFALYDYLTSVLMQKTEVKGIEQRTDLVDFCNRVAKTNSFSGLSFIPGSIAEMDCAGQDILIALHACDTATDDAIFQGIKANCELIVVAPCCHKQIRRQMEAKKNENDLAFITRHGLFLERQAEMVTDSIRALIMTYFGYKIKVIDFIVDTHTPKNVMLVGIKSNQASQKQADILKQIKEAKAIFGIDFHYLEKKLGLFSAL